MFFSVLLSIPFPSRRRNLGHSRIACSGRTALCSREDTGRVMWLASGSVGLPSLNEQVRFAAGFPVCCLQYQSRTRLNLSIWIHSQLLIHCFSYISPYDHFFWGSDPVPFQSSRHADAQGIMLSTPRKLFEPFCCQIPSSSEVPHFECFS